MVNEYVHKISIAITVKNGSLGRFRPSLKVDTVTDLNLPCRPH
jgi:hypothetical protein